tara:strand:- start:304 stop:411 length:108 start_codon:yes stop_codon:yes gene_type:complete
MNQHLNQNTNALAVLRIGKLIYMKNLAMFGFAVFV